MGIGTWEVFMICGVIVLLFGTAAIPKLARSLGKAKSEFEKGLKEGGKEEENKSANPSPDSSAGKE